MICKQARKLKRMTCRQAEALIWEEADGHLSDKQRKRLEEHLTVCEACTVKLQVARKTLAVLHDARYESDGEMKTKIVKQIAAYEKTAWPEPLRRDAIKKAGWQRTPPRRCLRGVAVAALSVVFAGSAVLCMFMAGHNKSFDTAGGEKWNADELVLKSGDGVADAGLSDPKENGECWESTPVSPNESMTESAPVNTIADTAERVLAAYENLETPPQKVVLCALEDSPAAVTAVEETLGTSVWRATASEITKETEETADEETAFNVSEYLVDAENFSAVLCVLNNNGVSSVEYGDETAEWILISFIETDTTPGA